MTRIGKDFENTVLELLESTGRNLKAMPINLGGISGPGGGVGIPPAGFVGQLSQTRVAYDTSEIGTNYTPPSGASLLDNLNHIRYRLDVIESGGATSLTVREIDGDPSVASVNTITFSGAIVSDLGGGEALVRIVGGSGGGIEEAPIDGKEYGRKNGGWADLGLSYLKLDASNDPLTGSLAVIPQGTGDAGIYIETDGDAYPLDVEQFTTTQNVTVPTVFLYRETTGGGNITAPMIEGLQYKAGGGNITGKFIQLSDATTGKFFHVESDGSVNIPSGSFYKINGVPLTFSGGGAVSSVNGQTGDVVLDAGDIQKLPSNLQLFLIDASSDVGGYRKLETNPGNSTTNINVTLTASDTLLEEFIAPAGMFSFLPRQAIHFRINVSRAGISTQKKWFLYAKIFHRTSAGVETLLCTTTNSIEIDAPTVVDIVGETENKIFSATDRLVVKFYGTPTGTGDDPTAYLIFSGQDTESNFSLGANILQWGNIGGTLSSQTDLQAALDAKASNASLTSHINQTTDAHDASAISITDSGDFYTSTNVEGALQEAALSAISGKITFLTNSNEFFRFQSVRLTQFTATINGTPSGSTVVFNAPTAGSKNELAQYNGSGEQTSSNICAVLLRNVTRGNAAIISDVNLSTNTITLAGTVPANWANGDTITTDAGLGSSYRAVQIKDTSVIPNNATQLLLFVQVLDSAQSVQAWLQSYETFSAPKTWAVAHTAGANLSLTSFVTLPLISRRLLWQVRSPASDTATLVCRIIGYQTS